MCSSGYGVPTFDGALFVVHPTKSDGRIHGPFFLAEEALAVCRRNSVVYKNANLTTFEFNYIHSAAPQSRWLAPSTFIPNPTPKATRSRASKLIALARMQSSGAYYAVLRDSQFLLRRSGVECCIATR